MIDQAHKGGAPLGSRSSANRDLIPVPDMMTSHPMFLLPIPTLRTAFREKFLAALR